MSNTTNRNQPYVAAVPPRVEAQNLFRKFNNTYDSADRANVAQEIDVGAVESKPGMERKIQILIPPVGEIAICVEAKEKRTMGRWHYLGPEFHTAQTLHGELKEEDKPRFSAVFETCANNVRLTGNHVLAGKLAMIGMALKK